ncbi:MAG: BrnT family toxin [Proteobacteria bacterium]|nr:BrnT family toxin [Pseudomonadota bacterium]
MEFEWDEAKRRLVHDEHGVDLVEMALVFRDATRLDWVDSRRDYGEERRVTLGEIRGEAFVVVYTIRAGRIRLITAWRASHDDEKRYKDRNTR